MKKFNQKKAFTLIELLVVIAIIGILASVIMVGLQGGRAGASDSRAVSGMSQLRGKAEMYYSTNGNSYANFSCTVDQEMKDICADIEKQLKGIGTTGGKITIQATTAQYCAYIPLNVKYKDQQDYYCIDSTGKAGNTVTNPNTTCNASSKTCPTLR